MSRNVAPSDGSESDIVAGTTTSDSDSTWHLVESRIGGNEPRDKWHLAYIVFVLAGTGFLFPYNSFITGVDYFQIVYPTEKYAFIATAVYFYTTLFAVFLNNLLLRIVGLGARIRTGYVVFAIALATVLVVNSRIDTRGSSLSFGLTLFAIALVSLAGGLQQASFYGFAGMLPKRYVQAIMAGESVAGLIVSIDRVVTKAAISDCRASSLAFFGLSLAFNFICALGYEVVRRSPFVKYHLAMAKSTSGSGVMDLGRYAKLDDIDESVEMESIDRKQKHQSARKSPLKDRVLGALRARLSVSRRIWLYMLSIGLTYFLTLLIFPGLLTEIRDDDGRRFSNGWLPVILIALFNFFDFIGKLIGSWHYNWRPGHLVSASILRFILLPLFLFCVLPCNMPFFSSSTSFVAMGLVSVFGLTNGYFGCMSMVLAPAQVEPNRRELAGNLMTLVMLIGLTAGASFAFLLNRVTGSEPGNLCFSNSTQVSVSNCTHV